MKKYLMIFSIIIVCILSLFFYVHMKFNIKRHLPDNIVVQEEFRSSGLGNGDTCFAFKAIATKQQYEKFCKSISIFTAKDIDREVIGFFPSDGDLPQEERRWWDEPDSPECKSFSKEERGFTRISFSNGAIYYYSRTW